MKSIECIGKTAADAIASGLAQLGLTQDQVEIEVLDAGSKGFLGIGTRMARVRMTSLVAEEEPAAPAPAPVVEDVEEPAVEEPVSAIPADFVATVIDENTNDTTRAIVEFITGLAERMGAGEVFVAIHEEDGILKVRVEGENVGSLIGHRGETLDSIQLLTNLTVNQLRSEGDEKYRRISVDVGGYRRRREETLERLARRLAGKAIRTRRNVVLEPMNSYERRIIHSALTDYEGVSTASQGEEPNRHVVITPDRRR